MAERERLICAATDLVEGGDGVRFELARRDMSGRPVPAFVVRYRGTPRAFVNRCAHVPVELDWTAGQFFDSQGLYLLCATHGATYMADTGLCVMGPCKGRRLEPLPVVERDGQVFLIEEVPPAA